MGLFDGLSETLFGSGASVSVPKPSEAELALRDVQKQQIDAFAPQVQQFSEKAFGEGIPSPLLQEQLKQQREQLLQDIRRRGGAGAEATTTAGIQRLGQFQTGANIATEEARLRNIALAGQLQGTLGGLSSNALAPYQQDRALQLQAETFNAQQRAQAQGALGSLVGGAALGALAAPLGGVSPLRGAALGALGGTGLISQFGDQQRAGNIETYRPTTRPIGSLGSLGADYASFR